MMKATFYRVTLVLVLLFMAAGAAHATDISGAISSTMTITQDSKLTGNVSCTVSGNPYIQFGAPGIKLRRNGYTMTGTGLAFTCPTEVEGENGINTNGENDVSIEGPGIVQRFLARGIWVTGNDSIVKHVTVLSTCKEGIEVDGYQDRIEDNSLARAGLDSTTATTATISVRGTGNHTIRRNEMSAAGPVSFSYGFGFYVTSTNNIIEENSSSGMPYVGLYMDTGATGNKVKKNQFLGNAADHIYDKNAPGDDDYDWNLCETSYVETGPGSVCQVPNISGHENSDGDA
jgi:hypothetical protein